MLLPLLSRMCVLDHAPASRLVGIRYCNFGLFSISLLMSPRIRSAWVAVALKINPMLPGLVLAFQIG